MYLKEDTTHELMLSIAHVVNVTQLNIMPYSDDTDREPEVATINGVDEGVLAGHPGTSFNILKDFELRTDINIIEIDDISESEKEMYIQTTSVLMIIRSNFKMTKISVTSEFSSDFRDYVILYALYLQEKLIELYDLSFSTSGIILYSHYPFLLHAQNIEVDLYRNLGGFHSDIE